MLSETNRKHLKHLELIECFYFPGKMKQERKHQLVVGSGKFIIYPAECLTVFDFLSLLFYSKCLALHECARGQHVWIVWFF